VNLCCISIMCIILNCLKKLKTFVQNKSIERLQQKSAAADEECASALKHKSFYDRESLTVASLRAIVRQYIDRQNEPVENKLTQYVRTEVININEQLD